METWRKELYEFYTTNKGRNQKLNTPNCDFFKHRLLPLLPKNKEIKILDLAAGHGALLYCLKQTGYNNVKGVDISIEEVERGKQIGVEELEQGDLFEYVKQSKDSYDLIFLMDILEHFKREELFGLLKDLKEKLNPGGSLIIQVPNGSGVFGMRIRYGDITHETAYSHNSMLQILTSQGFTGIQTFEMSPIKSGIKGFIRNLMWHMLAFPLRLMIILETGEKKHILSQNMLIRASL